MKGSKRVRLSLLFLFSCITLPAQSDLKDNAFSRLLQKRLSEHIPYRQALLERRRAELNLQQYENFAIPYGTISAGREGIVFKDEELQPLVFQPELRWTHVLGTDIGIQAPLNFDEGDMLSTVRLSAARDLFSEDRTNILKARAALLKARESEIDTRMTVYLTLLEDILGDHIATERRALNKRNLEVLEKELAATMDRATLRSLQQRILRAQRELLQAEQTLMDRDQSWPEELAILKNQALEAAELWLEELPTSEEPPDSSLAIAAQEYTLAAAQWDKKLGFLSYLPNPKLGFNLEYTVPTHEWNWDLSLQFTLTLTDRGERSLDALRRQEQPEIEQLRLKQAYKNLEDSFQRIKNRYDLLEYDMLLQEYTLEDTVEAEEHAEQMYHAGFTNEESILLARIDRERAELDMQEIQHQKLLGRLELIAVYEKAGYWDE